MTANKSYSFMVDYFAVLMFSNSRHEILHQLLFHVGYIVHTSGRENFSTMCEKGDVPVPASTEAMNVQYRPYALAAMIRSGSNCI